MISRLESSCSFGNVPTEPTMKLLLGDGKPGDHWGGTIQSQGDELSKDEGSLNTVRGVGKRVAEITLRMAASAK